MADKPTIDFFSPSKDGGAFSMEIKCIRATVKYKMFNQYPVLRCYFCWPYS